MAGGDYFGTGFWPDHYYAESPGDYWPKYVAAVTTDYDPNMSYVGAGLAGFRTIKRELWQWNMILWPELNYFEES